MNANENSEQDLLPEYHFDYTKAKPNRFAEQPPVTITLDADIAAVFKDAKAVNNVLRAIVLAMPHTSIGENI